LIVVELRVESCCDRRIVWRLFLRIVEELLCKRRELEAIVVLFLELLKISEVIVIDNKTSFLLDLNVLLLLCLLKIYTVDVIEFYFTCLHFCIWVWVSVCLA